MDLDIDGKRALVLAAGGGLGGAIARALAAEGVVVAAVDVAVQQAEATAHSVGERGGIARAFAWDIGELAAAQGLVDQVQAAFGGVDILVNITGGPPPTSASGVSPAVWRTHFESMVLGVIHLTDLVLPSMQSTGWGRVITSASSGVVTPIPDLAVSNSLRMALVGWSKTLSREVGRFGITSNVVVPGRIATDRIRQLDVGRATRESKPVKDIEAASTASIPLGRYGNPDEYGRVVAFLASNAASYITGSLIRVDGGLVPSV